MAVTKFKTTSSFTNLTKYDSMLAGNNAFSPGVFESIASATGTGASATITLSSIPATYKSLHVRFIGKSTNTGISNTYVWVRLNGLSTAIYARHALTGDGTTVAASGAATQTEMETLLIAPGSSTNVLNSFNVGIYDIHNYASTTYNKTIRAMNGFNSNTATDSEQDIRLSAGLFASAAAISSISFICGSGSWTTSTQVALYGVN